MRFLSVETSGPQCVVAIGGEEGLLCGAGAFCGMGRQDGLILLIAQCLKKAKLKLGAIDYFGVGVGPGSFTGTRIALSTVKALSFSTGKPCLPFSSLDAIAYACLPVSFERLAVFVDAKRESFYANVYERIKKKGAVSLLRLSKREQLLKKQEVEGFLKKFAAGGRQLVFAGDGSGMLKGEIIGHKRRCLLPQDFWYPTPGSIARLTLERFRAGCTTDASKVSAVYLYARDCQVKRALDTGARKGQEA